MIIRPRLINAEYPLTQIEARLIHEGDLVEIFNGRTKIWVQIANVKTRGYFDGFVSSRLNEKTYNFGDLVHFHSRHIYSISKSESLQYS
jgi:hypothetical protein